MMPTPIQKSPDAFLTINEVAEKINIEPHIIRFWQRHIPKIKPIQKENGRHYYRPKDVELLRRIHKLLKEEGYSISGVKQLLANKAKKPATLSIHLARAECTDQMVGFLIGTVASALNVHQQTLRKWDSRLSNLPTARDENAPLSTTQMTQARRLYSEDHVIAFAIIQYLIKKKGRKHQSACHEINALLAQKISATEIAQSLGITVDMTPPKPVRKKRRTTSPNPQA